jgi:hypothetical protein
LCRRTNLDIDDDVLQAAKELVRAEQKTAGKVISELARRALTQRSGQGGLNQIEIRDGIPGAAIAGCRGHKRAC